MATRNGTNASINLQEAMALLIRNQAAFVEQLSRNDQEPLALERESKERFARIEEWQRKSEERFVGIEAQLAQLPKRIVQPSSIRCRESRKRLASRLHDEV